MSFSTSNSFTDPFSAVYKARPGELPSFFSVEDYVTHKDKRVKEGQVDDPKQAVDHPSANLEHPTKSYDHFSPLLAGESDRGLRKRFLSNPEDLFSLSSSPKATETSSSFPSEKTEISFALSDSSLGDPKYDDDDVLSFFSLDSCDENEEKDEKNDHEGRLPPFHVLGRTRADTIQLNPLERSSILTHSGIFFSPPKNLESIETSKQTEHEPRDVDRLDDKLESNLKANSRERFFAAVYRAILYGDLSIDLDNQNISQIPSLSHLLDQVSRRTDSSHTKTSAQIIRLIEKLTDRLICSKGSCRQPITRSKSAPEVTFSTPAVSLFLSNNFLNSHSSAIQRICHLQGLQHLSLRSNLLTTIPDELGDLKNLKYLNLANNRLTFLPASILKLANCQLVLHGNPWLRLPSTAPPRSVSDAFSSSSAPSHHQNQSTFTWISKPDKVFQFGPSFSGSLDPIQLTAPSLSENCIRKICITKDSNTGKETIIEEHQERTRKLIQTKMDEGNSSSSSTRAILLPGRIKRILLNPQKYFYKCHLCDHKLVLKESNAGFVPISPPHPAGSPPDFRNPNYFFQFRKFSRDESNQSPTNLDENGQGQDGANRTNEELDQSHQNLIPVRWKACSLSCCLENLIKS